MIKYSYIFLAVILGFVASLGWMIQTPGHNWGGDFALYIEQGQSLVEGTSQQLVRDTKYSLEKSTMKTFSPELYSWGYPLLLAPVLSVTSLNYSWLKGYQLFLFLFMLLLFYIWLKQHLTSFEALLLTAVWSLHPVYLLYTDVLLSEIPYIGALLLAVIAINRCYVKDYSPRWFDWILCGLALWGVMLVRHEGILLLAGLVAVQGTQMIQYDEGWKAYFANHPKSWIPYGIAVIGMVVLNLLLPSGTTSNFQHWALLDIHIMDNVSYYATLPAKLFGVWGASTLYIASLPFFFWGILNRFPQDMLYTIYLMLLFGVLVVWPHQAGVRYILSVFPFYLYFAYRGAMEATRFFLETDRRMIPRLGMALLGLLFGIQSVLIASNRPDAVTSGPEHPASRKMFDYISEKSQSEDVIVFFKPRVMHLYTARRSVIVENPAQMNKGDYYVMHKYKGNYNQHLIHRAEDRDYLFLHPVFENDRFKVFKIRSNEE